MLERQNLRKFTLARNRAETASKNHKYPEALEMFEKADRLAIFNDDDPRRFEVLIPTAHMLWGMRRYDEAGAKLETAIKIADSLGDHEQGIGISAFGRLATNKIVQTAPSKRQSQLLSSGAVPNFERSYEILKGSPDPYSRYDNAQHGALAAALGSDRELTVLLILEGLETAFRRPEPAHAKKLPAEVNPGGLARLASAAALLPLGNHTPFLARFARSRLID
jgi:tetratricopeptide (TPR) repeat protein